MLHLGDARINWTTWVVGVTAEDEISSIWFWVCFATKMLNACSHNVGCTDTISLGVFVISCHLIFFSMSIVKTDLAYKWEEKQMTYCIEKIASLNFCTTTVFVDLFSGYLHIYYGLYKARNTFRFRSFSNYYSVYIPFKHRVM